MTLSGTNTWPRPKLHCPVSACSPATETSPSILYGLYDVLSTVGAIYREMTVGEAGNQVLDVKIVGVTAEPFRAKPRRGWTSWA